MYKINMLVRVFNSGGMPEQIKEFHRSYYEQAKESGQITEAEFTENIKALEDASRPVSEQFRFSRTIEVPFVPGDDTGIKIDGFVFHPINLVWNVETGEFDAEMGMSLCSKCDPDTCCLESLKAHWEWLPPVTDTDEEDDQSREDEPSEPDSD